MTATLIKVKKWYHRASISIWLIDNRFYLFVSDLDDQCSCHYGTSRAIALRTDLLIFCHTHNRNNKALLTTQTRLAVLALLFTDLLLKNVKRVHTVSHARTHAVFDLTHQRRIAPGDPAISVGRLWVYRDP